jgi:hypothetical protein
VVHDAGLDYARVVHDAGLGEPLLVVAVLGAFALALGLALALLVLAMILSVLALVGVAFVASILAVIAALLALVLAMFLALVVAWLRCRGRGAEAGDQQGHHCRRGKGSGAGLDFHGVTLVRRQAHPLARGPLNVKSA